MAAHPLLLGCSMLSDSWIYLGFSQNTRPTENKNKKTKKYENHKKKKEKEKNKKKNKRNNEKTIKKRAVRA